MTDTVLTVIIGATAGIVGGGITSLIAPWVQWEIKKKEKRYESRKERIAAWRSLVKELANKPPTGDDEDHIGASEFLEKREAFYSLRKHLPEEMYKDLWRMNDDLVVEELTVVINKVADEWGLD
jgi:hypothetical protein